MTKLKTIIQILSVALLFTACSKNSATIGSQSSVPSAAPGSQTPAATTTTGEIHYKAPSGWVTEKPTSDMRLAQYKLPKADGDTDDGLLVVFYFGPGQGGTPQANIDRWVGQVKQADGSDSKDKAKTATMKVNGLQVTTVDVLGSYSGGMSPDSAPKDKASVYRLRGAVIETPKGAYFVKLTGPEKTLKHWDQAYTDYIDSFEFK